MSAVQDINDMLVGEGFCARWEDKGLNASLPIGALVRLVREAIDIVEAFNMVTRVGSQDEIDSFVWLAEARALVGEVTDV